MYGAGAAQCIAGKKGNIAILESGEMLKVYTL